MDYSPLVTDKIFGEAKTQIFKCAEKLKNCVFRPAAGGNFWGPKPIMDYSPLVIDHFLTRGGGNSP